MVLTSLYRETTLRVGGGSGDEATSLAWSAPCVIRKSYIQRDPSHYERGLFELRKRLRSLRWAKTTTVLVILTIVLPSSSQGFHQP